MRNQDDGGVRTICFVRSFILFFQHFNFLFLILEVPTDGRWLPAGTQVAAKISKEGIQIIIKKKN